MSKKPQGAPSKEASKDLFGETPKPVKADPVCSNCKHFTGKSCGLVLPPFIRITERPFDRLVHPEFVCSFHKA